MLVITQLDARAIDSLFNEHYAALSRYAFTMLRNQEQAEDVVQQLFIHLWEKRNELDEMENARAYLYRATHNRCLNELNRQKRQGMHLAVDEVHHLESDAGRGVLTGELEDQISAAVQTLPEKCQEVFRMSRFEDLSYKEIAESLDISVKTVENHMGKALRILREELKDYLPQFLITLLLTQGW